MSVVPICDRDPAEGTLLWIGDTSIPEFQPAYRHCLRNAAQIAVRENVFDAVRRPAWDVRGVVVARTSRLPGDGESLASLSQRYRDASWIDLLGPLCEGIRQSSIAESNRVPWHRWDQYLPRWFGDARAGTTDSGSSLAVGSVAVITSSFESAQAYLDLAASHKVAAVWCTTNDATRTRNIEAVWWDDSVAEATNADNWRKRVSSFACSGRRIRHAWITHAAWLDHREAAVQGGIDTIISKPYQIDSLLESLGETRQLNAPSRHAA